jgi:hypothetical protein
LIYFGNVCVTNTNCEQQIPPKAGFCFLFHSAKASIFKRGNRLFLMSFDLPSGHILQVAATGFGNL